MSSAQPIIASGASIRRPGPGRVEALWLKRAHREPMDAVSSVRAIVGKGLEGNVGSSRIRQVTILEREIWDELMRELGSDAHPSVRRANLLVSGISLGDSRGRVLRVGDVELTIAGEVKPCERMEEAVPGLRALMYPDWRGGAFAQVTHEGELRLGDRVSWAEPWSHP